MGDILPALLAQLSPIIVNLGVTLIVVVATWALGRWGITLGQVKIATGLDIEASARAALQMALENGVKAALGAGNTDPNVVAQLAVTHARASVPGAISTLKPPDQVLMTIAKSKIVTMTKPGAQ